MSNKKLKIDRNLIIEHENREFTFKELIDFYLNRVDSINHKVYRRIVKKVERKFKRQNNVRNKPDQIDSDVVIDDDNEIENSKAHQLWLERERLAQIEWQAKKELESRKAAQLSAKKHKSKNENSKRTILENDRDKEDEDEKATTTDTTHNPELTTLDWNQLMLLREPCKYFIRTGVCRNGNMCNRSHFLDAQFAMTTLIFPSMYRYMLRGYELLRLNNESDEILEYEEKDIKENFKVFYDEILAEFRKHGRVTQLLVCSNYQVHLRGNVYVEYEREEEAKNAYRLLNNEWEFRGKRVFCFFTHVKNWKEAICGNFLRNRCENAQKCNYLHVFQNPYNEFPIHRRNVNVNNESSINRTTTRKNDDDKLKTSKSQSHHRRRSRSPNESVSSNKRHRK